MPLSRAIQASLPSGDFSIDQVAKSSALAMIQKCCEVINTDSVPTQLRWEYVVLIHVLVQVDSSRPLLEAFQSSRVLAVTEKFMGAEFKESISPRRVSVPVDRSVTLELWGLMFERAQKYKMPFVAVDAVKVGIIPRLDEWSITQWQSGNSE